MKHLVSMLALVVGLLAPAICLQAADARKPNIIFILADDFGIPAIGCYGGAYKTPHLDALAAGGMSLVAEQSANAIPVKKRKKKS